MMKCRGCLSGGSLQMIPFDEQIIRNFNLLTNLNVQLYDVLPQQLCEYCYDMVNLFQEFKEKCILANSVLFDYISKQDIKKENEEKYIEIENIYVKKEEKEAVSDFNEKNISSNYNVHDNYDYEFNSNVQDSMVVSVIVPEEKAENCFTYVKKPKKVKKTKCKMQAVTLSCGLCIEVFKDRNLLIKHLEVHKKANLICEICLQNFCDWPQLFSHRLKHVIDEQKSCHICLKKYQSPPYLEYHYKKMHCNDEKPMLGCFQCNKTYSVARKLYKHMIACHSEKTFICDYCSKVYTNKSFLSSHVIGHMKHKPFKCDKCDYSAKYLANLKTHIIRKHTKKCLRCQSCTMIFADQQKYDAHVCNAVPRICPICGKSFKGNQLNKHMRTHEVIGKYRCERCDAAYKSRAALRVHCNRHDGVRASRCDLCPAAFYSASVLIKHRRTHTGIKPYVCNICNKAFTGNHNLKLHMRVHGKNLIAKKSMSEEIIT